MSRPIQSQLSTLNVPGGPPFSLRVPYPSDGRPTELSIPWPLPTPIDKPINFDPDTERPHATVANNGVVSAIGFVESATGSDIFSGNDGHENESPPIQADPGVSVVGFEPRMDITCETDMNLPGPSRLGGSHPITVHSPPNDPDELTGNSNNIPSQARGPNKVLFGVTHIDKLKRKQSSLVFQRRLTRSQSSFQKVIAIGSRPNIVQPQNYTSPYTRKPFGRKIYGQPYRTLWYASEGRIPIISPPALNPDDNVSPGTLYLHRYKSASIEGSDIWIYSHDHDQQLHWQKIDEGHPRKFGAKQYVLSLNKKHKPAWVQPYSFDRSRGLGPSVLVIQ